VPPVTVVAVVLVEEVGVNGSESAPPDAVALVSKCSAVAALLPAVDGCVLVALVLSPPGVEPSDVLAALSALEGVTDKLVDATAAAAVAADDDDDENDGVGPPVYRATAGGAEVVECVDEVPG